jgi:hypothetical protein
LVIGPVDAVLLEQSIVSLCSGALHGSSDGDTFQETCDIMAFEIVGKWIDPVSFDCDIDGVKQFRDFASSDWDSIILEDQRGVDDGEFANY